MWPELMCLAAGMRHAAITEETDAMRHYKFPWDQDGHVIAMEMSVIKLNIPAGQKDAWVIMPW
jgi:hypothetical protein